MPITDEGFDSHIQCFLGYLGVATPVNPNPDTDPTGPENSLTRWSDQGDAEILCDYGAAYSLMEFLSGRYGTSFMSALHRGDENGLAGLQEALSHAVRDERVARSRRRTSCTTGASMVALDGLIDRGLPITGRPKESSVTTPTLDASINWECPPAPTRPRGHRRTAPTTFGSDGRDGSYLAGERHQQHRLPGREDAADDTGASGPLATPESAGAARRRGDSRPVARRRQGRSDHPPGLAGLPTCERRHS